MWSLPSAFLSLGSSFSLVFFCMIFTFFFPDFSHFFFDSFTRHIYVPLLLFFFPPMFLRSPRNDSTSPPPATFSLSTQPFDVSSRAPSLEERIPGFLSPYPFNEFTCFFFPQCVRGPFCLVDLPGPPFRPPLLACFRFLLDIISLQNLTHAWC